MKKPYKKKKATINIVNIPTLSVSPLEYVLIPEYSIKHSATANTSSNISEVITPPGVLMQSSWFIFVLEA